MNRNISCAASGFTILELLVCLSIMGILAAVSVFGIGKYIGEQRSEQIVVTLWSELNTLRARAVKDDCPYLVTIDRQNGKYQVYRNDSCDFNVRAPFSTPINSGVGTVSGKISINVPIPIPTKQLTSAQVGWNMPISTFPIRGKWMENTVIFVGGQTIDSTIVFNCDPVGSISDGVLFLRNTSVPSVGYALVKSFTASAIDLYKWDGSKWYKL